MNITELVQKYNLIRTDTWFHKQSNRWILTNDACEKIATEEKIELTWEMLCAGPDFVYLKVTGKKGNKAVETSGEASKSNCMMPYYLAMALKRGKNRATLMIINAYEYGISSEVEADDFKRPASTPNGVNQNG